MSNTPHPAVPHLASIDAERSTYTAQSRGARETLAAPRHVLWCRRLYFMVAWPAPSRMKEAPPFASESLFLICGCEQRRGGDQRVDYDERCEAAGRDLHPEIRVQLVPAVDLDLLVLPVVSQPLCPLLELSCRDRACARTQCPIMLGMVSNMALIKYKSQPLNPIMVAAAIIRTVFGISATVRELCLAVHGLFCVAGR